jgi:predicted nucleic acid-binding protein
MIQGRITIDTNILLRAADRDSKDHQLAKDVLFKLSEHEVDIYISPQIIYEFWVVLTRPIESNGLGLDVETTYNIIKETLIYYPCITENENLFPTWLEMVVKYKVIGVRAHDIRLAAWMKNNKIEEIVTFNTNDFKNLGIEVIHPLNLINVLD